MATQNANAIAVTGGTETGIAITNSTIDNSPIGNTTRSTVKATTLDLGLSTQSVAIGQGNASIMKNRIINGAMVIDQRNAGASVATNTNNNVYTLDRWNAVYGTQNFYTVQQNSGSVTPPAGFTNYLGVVSSGANTADIELIQQAIEGFNTADLNWGTANAKTVTLSFWARSSLTGTFGGSLQNSANNRSYPFTYTINAANTWEYKAITIAGDTSGTWIGATNGIGLRINISLGANVTYSGTAGAWAGADYRSATGATSVVGTSGATFYITGVQLEVGSSATGFEYVNYQTSLANCQRYYYKVQSGIYSTFAMGFNASTTTFAAFMVLPVTMRIAATNLEYSNLETYDPSGGNYFTTALSVSALSSTNNMAGLGGSFTGPSALAYPCILRASNSASGYIALNAEL
jgi:hypothetical protein